MKTVTVYRQGDVNLIPVSELPKSTHIIKPDKGRVVLAYGEVTGHAHALPTGYAKQYTLPGDNPRSFVEILKPTQLRHEEHAPIDLPVGKYEKVIAREWTPGGQRQVAD